MDGVGLTSYNNFAAEQPDLVAAKMAKADFSGDVAPLVECRCLEAPPRHRGDVWAAKGGDQFA